MKDWLHKLLKVVDYERGKVIGIILAIVIVFGMYGCEVEVQSLISGEKVTRAEFAKEVQAEKLKINEKVALIDKLQAEVALEAEALEENMEKTEQKFAAWEQLKQRVFEIGGGVIATIATGGKVNTTDLIMTLLAAAGIGGTVGGIYDSKRKNEKIITEKERAEKVSVAVTGS